MTSCLYHVLAVLLMNTFKVTAMFCHILKIHFWKVTWLDYLLKTKTTTLTGPVSPVSVSSLAPPSPTGNFTRSVSAEALRQLTRRATIKRGPHRSFQKPSVAQLEAIQKGQRVLDARLKVCFHLLNGRS